MTEAIIISASVICFYNFMCPQKMDGPEESGPLHFKIPRYENKRNNDNTWC